ncbi:MAG TPA: hypothetical protein VIY49_00190 [Bryobacteraceae bacterium]
MTVFDLLFLACLFTAAATLLMAAVAAIRGQWAHCASILKRLAMGVVAYLALGLIVGIAAPQRILNVGDPWCFDDWCLSVENVRRTAAGPDDVYRVSLRIFSRAKRVSQRAKGAWIYLIDPHGHRFEPQPDPAAVPLDVRLDPGESVTTSRTFRVPADAIGLGLITGHGGPYCWSPIIGETGCLFHKPTMVRLGQDFSK